MSTKRLQINFEALVAYWNENILHSITRGEFSRASGTSASFTGRILEDLPPEYCNKNTKRGDNGYKPYVPLKPITTEILYEIYNKQVQEMRKTAASKSLDPLFKADASMTPLVSLLTSIDNKLDTLIGLWQPKEERITP